MLPTSRTPRLPCLTLSLDGETTTALPDYGASTDRPPVPARSLAPWRTALHTIRRTASMGERQQYNLVRFPSGEPDRSSAGCRWVS